MKADCKNWVPKGMIYGRGAATVYFWPGLADRFREVHRATKPGGTFFICNESNGETSKDDKWVEKIGGMTIYTAAQIMTALKQAGILRCESRQKR